VHISRTTRKVVAPSVASVDSVVNTRWVAPSVDSVDSVLDPDSV
jgi:hypothetical protein